MPERATGAAAYDESIFLNCPFDDAYKPVFHALVFAAFDCGYVPRCALEADDAGQARVEKILAIVRGCRLGVHDISRTELDARSEEHTSELQSRQYLVRRLLLEKKYTALPR